MNTIEKIQQCMNILAGIRPRVDQLNEITYPIVGVINTLADVRDSLNKPTENAKAEETEE